MTDEFETDYPTARVSTVADLIAALAAYPPDMLVGGDWNTGDGVIVRVTWFVGIDGPHAEDNACPVVQLDDAEDEEATAGGE